jgi:hypothetical protein
MRHSNLLIVESEKMAKILVSLESIKYSGNRCYLHSFASVQKKIYFDNINTATGKVSYSESIILHAMATL